MVYKYLDIGISQCPLWKCCLVIRLYCNVEDISSVKLAPSAENPVIIITMKIENPIIIITTKIENPIIIITICLMVVWWCLVVHSRHLVVKTLTNNTEKRQMRVKLALSVSKLGFPDCVNNRNRNHLFSGRPLTFGSPFSTIGSQNSNQ